MWNYIKVGVWVDYAKIVNLMAVDGPKALFIIPLFGIDEQALQTLRF